MRLLARLAAALTMMAAEGAPVPAAAASEVVITTVFDNELADSRLAARWGFAAVVATPNATVLFDTGSDGATLLANMRKLRLDPRGIQTVVISHSHNDHVGGLAGFLGANPDVRVLTPPRFPERLRRAIAAAGARYRDVSGPGPVAPGIHTTGPLGAASREEQALVVETRDGVVVITGCAHPGIVTVVRTVRATYPHTDIVLVMGGFHLVSAAPGEVDAVVGALRTLGVRRVAPSHCTGDAARRRFEDAYGPDYIAGGAGRVLRFEAARDSRP